jgi:hypothetical protein
LYIKAHTTKLIKAYTGDDTGTIPGFRSGDQRDQTGVERVHKINEHNRFRKDKP